MTLSDVLHNPKENTQSSVLLCHAVAPPPPLPQAQMPPPPAQSRVQVQSQQLPQASGNTRQLCCRLLVALLPEYA